MKIAALDTEDTIWGIGSTEDDALYDAYKNMDEEVCRGGHASVWDTYEDFKRSSDYEQLELINITDAAVTAVREIGGIKDLWYGKLAIEDGTIMTVEEHREKYGDD